MKFLAAGLMLRRRRELTEEVLSGKFTVELPDWRERRKREREGDAFSDHCAVDLLLLDRPN
jgi:hypothetical protein